MQTEVVKTEAVNFVCIYCAFSAVSRCSYFTKTHCCWGEAHIVCVMKTLLMCGNMTAAFSAATLAVYDEAHGP